ncbi:putative mating locus protein [Aspergillus ellipticus CBS 707.79]|uniref:Putative mating locus protein n=1 Tax=Aspergillus ellipticus CBS 707.79 TaxID=1448320 RepID=A0A319CWN7_9EURO|nr:putative mating locus protein [Aspergillus ellipticus CBS 707.79]
MDPNAGVEIVATTILKYLDGMAKNATNAADLREKAMYISATFRTHNSVARLMAQVSALNGGEELIHPSHRADGPAEAAEKPVRRYANFLQSVMADYHVTPTIADIEGHPIQLMGFLDPQIERILHEHLFEFHRVLLRAEKKANHDLARVTKQFGYHYIFRIGLMEYYLSKTIAENVNFIRPDGRGDAYRVRAQTCFYNVMEQRVRLNDAEKQIVIRAMGCQPADAHRFWTWLERNRVAYQAMKACLALLHNLK